MSAILRTVANHSRPDALHYITLIYCGAAVAAYIMIALLHIVKSKLTVVATGFAIISLFGVATSSVEVQSFIDEEGTRTTVYLSELDRLMWGTLWFMPLVLAGVAVLSYSISLMSARRREHLC